MSTPRRRALFQPDVIRGDDPAALATAFAGEAAEYRLEWRCVDCAYFRAADGRCTTGWPNDALVREPPAVFRDDGSGDRAPVFCKSFESLGS